jgi:uncharacterized membrane protein HdeD (DUF308 family)
MGAFDMAALTKAHGNALRMEGIIIVILGLLAILLPRVVTLGIGMLLGLILLVAGFLKFVRAMKFRGMSGFGVSLVGALLLEVAGLLLLVNPWEGAAVLTLILVFLFLFEGVGELGFAFQYRSLSARSWIVASGVASLVIALLLLFSWPHSAAWAIGLLVGINLLFTGAWLLAVSSMLRRTVSV